MDDNVVRLWVNGRKMEPGMNAQLYTLATADWRLDEISAEHTGFFSASWLRSFVRAPPAGTAETY